MGLLIFILFLALAAGILALALYHEKKRREALERVAAQLGMRFSAQLPEEIRSRLLQAGFGLFERSHGRRFYNSMSKRLIDGTEITVFDYQYTRGSGKSSSTYRQSVFYAYHEDLHLPRFRLHPENAFFHGIAKAFGMQDINFESHPKFSRRAISCEERMKPKFGCGSILASLVFGSSIPTIVPKGPAPTSFSGRMTDR